MKHAPAAAILGLPAALLAHAVVFGSDHAVAGALQAVVLAAASSALIAMLALQTARFAQGSVVSRRLGDSLPATIPLALGASGWFAAIELCETRHAIAWLTVIAALALACVVIRAGVRAFAQLLSHVVIAVARGFAALTVRALPVWRTHDDATASFQSAQRTFALFSRPPPALS